MLTFLQNMSGSHDISGGGSDGGGKTGEEAAKASDHCLRLHLNICEHDITGLSDEVTYWSWQES